MNGQGGPGLRYLPTDSSNTSKCRTVGATSVISTVCELQVINVSPVVISLAKHRSLRFEGCSLTRTVIQNLNSPQLIVNWSHVSWPTFEQPKHWIVHPSLPVFIGHRHFTPAAKLCINDVIPATATQPQQLPAASSWLTRLPSLPSLPASRGPGSSADSVQNLIQQNPSWNSLNIFHISDMSTLQRNSTSICNIC